MHGRAVLLTVSVAVLALILAAGCGGGGSTVLPPDEAMAASRARFVKVVVFQTSFHITVNTPTADVAIDGEAGYQKQGVAYTRQRFSDEKLTTPNATEILFLPPNLYMKTREGEWFVLSPWSQGIRPDRLDQLGPEKPIIDYAEFASHLSQVEQLADDDIDGTSYLHYRAGIDEQSVPWAVPPDFVSVRPSVSHSATTTAELWLNKEGYLPRRVRTHAERSGESASFTFEFFEYERPIHLPQPPAARPWRDLELPEAPCTGSLFDGCLVAQTELQPTAPDPCGGNERRVCLVPLGRISPGLMQHLLDHYREQYGLRVALMKPVSVPFDIANPLRGQVDADTLIRYMGRTYSTAYHDPEVVLIGITPLDLYAADSHFRYVFGVKGSPDDPKAVVSTFRMDPESYGEPPNEGVFYSRARKLLSKYIGLLYYGLPPSDDPLSPMYNSILGVTDVDNMGEPLPVSAPP
jgi:archaemetzincin